MNFQQKTLDCIQETLDYMRRLMSYDIALINRATGKNCTMPRQKIRGGTVPAEIDPATGKLAQAAQTDCSINITYNYGNYYYEATKDDPELTELVEGIRCLYGKTARESIPILEKMIEYITTTYQDEDHEWKIGTRFKIHYYYENGEECIDPIKAYASGNVISKVNEPYEISEGDISDYWETTAANALIPLTDMLNMALYNIGNADAVWDGD